MIAAALLIQVTVGFTELHGPEGQVMRVNPAKITTLREPARGDLRHFAPTVHCIVVTVNGKFLAVRETCEQVDKLARQ